MCLWICECVSFRIYVCQIFADFFPLNFLLHFHLSYALIAEYFVYFFSLLSSLAVLQVKSFPVPFAVKLCLIAAIIREFVIFAYALSTTNSIDFAPLLIGLNRRTDGKKKCQLCLMLSDKNLLMFDRTHVDSVVVPIHARIRQIRCPVKNQISVNVFDLQRSL